MINLYKLEDYNKEVKKGLTRLTNYNKAFFNLSFFSAFISIFALFYLYHLFSVDMNIKNNGISLDSVSLFINTDFNLIVALVFSGCLILSGLFSFLHSYYLNKQINDYLRHIHMKIIGLHKEIFKNHTEESVKAFSNEKDKDRLITILSNQEKHIDFVINNYDDFNITEID